MLRPPDPKWGSSGRQRSTGGGATRATAAGSGVSFVQQQCAGVTAATSSGVGLVRQQSIDGDDLGAAATYSSMSFVRPDRPRINRNKVNRLGSIAD